jgi:hypothetical protein
VNFLNPLNYFFEMDHSNSKPFNNSSAYAHQNGAVKEANDVSNNSSISGYLICKSFI